MRTPTPPPRERLGYRPDGIHREAERAREIPTTLLVVNNHAGRNSVSNALYNTRPPQCQCSLNSGV